MLQATLPLSASDLDRQITLEHKVVTRDPAYNSEVVEWEAEDDVTWAQVIESSTAPETNPGQGDGIAAYARPSKIRIRWRADFDKATTRVVYNGAVLMIIGTAELGRQQWLELACLGWAHES